MKEKITRWLQAYGRLLTGLAILLSSSLYTSTHTFPFALLSRQASTYFSPATPSSIVG